MYSLLCFSLFEYITRAKVVTKNSQSVSFRVVAFGTSDYLWSRKHNTYLYLRKKLKADKAVHRKAAAKSYINQIQKQITKKHKIKAMPAL